MLVLIERVRDGPVEDSLLVLGEGKLGFYLPPIDLPRPHLTLAEQGKYQAPENQLIDAVSAQIRARGGEHLEFHPRIANDAEVERAAAEIHREHGARRFTGFFPEKTQGGGHRFGVELDLPKAGVPAGFAQARQGDLVAPAIAALEIHGSPDMRSRHAPA